MFILFFDVFNIVKIYNEKSDALEAAIWYAKKYCKDNNLQDILEIDIFSMIVFQGYKFSDGNIITIYERELEN
jgi:hypothetical protein